MSFNGRISMSDFFNHYQPKAIAKRIWSTKSDWEKTLGATQQQNTKVGLLKKINRKLLQWKYYQPKVVAKNRVAKIITQKQL